MPTAVGNSRSMAALLCSILFASGAAALVFETLWFHQAGLAFGNSVWASSLVLSGFMAGLALGSLLVARYGTHLRQPLVIYSLLEGVVAVTGVLLVLTLPRLGSVFAPWFGSLSDELWALNALRLSASFLLLLLPSTAMGATLPLVTRVLFADEPNFGRVIGRLYGWNTLGAMLGTLAAAGPLIGVLGIRGAALVAAGLNLCAAVAALALARQWPAARGRDPVAPVSMRAAFGAALRPASLAAFGAGFTLLALEVVWFRFLLLFMPGTSVVFAWMLATVLAGIAVGGLAASRLLGRRPALRSHVALVAFLAGISCVASYAG